MIAKLAKSFENIATSMSLMSNHKIKMKIDTFNGKNEDANTWLFSYEKVFEANYWTSDLAKINNLRQNLDGIALKWFSARIAEDQEYLWLEWKTSFVSAFAHNRIQFALKAFKFEYRSGELLEFYYEKQRLLNIAFPHLDDFNFITMKVCALPESLQNTVQTMSINTKECLRDALVN